jgi:hypothetical protein
MSTITDSCKKYNITDFAELSMLEAFFAQPEISDELSRAEKFRKIRYAVLIPLVILITFILFYMASEGMWTVEV